MRFVQYETEFARGLGVRRGDRIVPVAADDLAVYLALPSGERAALLRAADSASALDGNVRLGPAHPRPGKMLFAGMTHRSTATDYEIPQRDHPYFYIKLPHTIVGDGEPILLPRRDSRLVHEVELAAVIGEPCRDVDPATALARVFGYTVINDITAWDELLATWDSWLCEFATLKNYDTFCPMATDVVTADELGDPGALTERTLVNDEVRQTGSTADMLWSVGEMLAWLSTRFTLEPGDLVSFGTPPGISELSEDDVVVCEIDRVGRVSNPVALSERAAA